MHTVDSFAVIFRRREPVFYVDAFDDEHPVLVFYFTFCLGYDTFTAKVNFTRLQRAGKGADQSTRGGCYYVIERGGVLIFLFYIDFIVLGDFTVNSERYRFFFCRKIG